MCKEKQPRLLFPEKAANSFLARPSEDRTGLQLTLVKTAKLIFWTRLAGMRGCSRNQGNESNRGRIKFCRELKSFHLATTSPIESRWSRAKLIRGQKCCESCSAHYTASKLFHHLPAANRVNFLRSRNVPKCSELFFPQKWIEIVWCTAIMNFCMLKLELYIPYYNTSHC